MRREWCHGGGRLTLELGRWERPGVSGARRPTGAPRRGSAAFSALRLASPRRPAELERGRAGGGAAEQSRGAERPSRAEERSGPGARGRPPTATGDGRGASHQAQSRRGLRRLALEQTAAVQGLGGSGVFFFLLHVLFLLVCLLGCGLLGYAGPYPCSPLAPPLAG